MILFCCYYFEYLPEPQGRLGVLVYSCKVQNASHETQSLDCTGAGVQMFEVVMGKHLCGDTEVGGCTKAFQTVLALSMHQVVHAGLLCYMDGPPGLGFVVVHGSASANQYQGQKDIETNWANNRQGPFCEGQALHSRTHVAWREWPLPTATDPF